nr:phage terminase small subunit P27 family [Bacillus subtilis]
MARRKQLTETLKGQITNEEREERLQQEEKLKDFSPLQEKPPYWLSTMAKNEWRRIYPHIINLPISELDSTLLAIYCNSYAQYREAMADIAKDYQVMFEKNSRGETVKKKNPSVDIMNSMSKEIRGIALPAWSVTGFTPTNRSVLDSDSEEDDEFGAMAIDDD